MNQEVGKVGMCPRVLRFASGGSQCCTWCLKHALFVKCTMKALKKVWKFMQFLLTNTENCELSCTACFSKSTSSWWHVCYCLLGPLTTTILFTCVHRQQPCWRLCQGSCALKAYSCRLDILFCRTCFRVYCDEDYRLLRSVMGLGACKVTPGVAVVAVLFLTNARIIPDNSSAFSMLVTVWQIFPLYLALPRVRRILRVILKIIEWNNDRLWQTVTMSRGANHHNEAVRRWPRTNSTLISSHKGKRKDCERLWKQKKIEKRA